MSNGKTITRRKNFNNCWITTISLKSREKWYNCIYLHFEKSEKTEHLLPKEKNEYGFNYPDCLLARMDVHSYLSFYEENTINGNKTYVKCGWDFSHFGDDYWQDNDYGDVILNRYSESINKQFEELLR
jgi:hypothetical protein